MEYCGVQILEYSDNEYCFCYQGRLITDRYGLPVLLKKESDYRLNQHKAAGFIDCLIALGEI